MFKMYSNIYFKEREQSAACQTNLGDHPMLNSTNKLVYVKQNFSHQNPVPPEPVKVLVNPNFNKKVFVNPNFNGNIRNLTPPTVLPKIHVNPNVQNLKLRMDMNEFKGNNKIHVNPNVLRNIPLNSKMSENCNKNITKEFSNDRLNHIIISTRTKLVRSTGTSAPESKIKKRRSSVRSKFKIIRSSLLEKPVANEKRIISKYKLIKSSPTYMKSHNIVLNKFKLDNRNSAKTSASLKNKKYVYVNRFLSISDIARNNLLKQNGNKSHVVNIRGVIYKKSPNSLKRTSDFFKKTNNIKKTQGNVICKSKYKLKKSPIVSASKKLNHAKISRHSSIVRKSTLKMRVCNIPCPYFRKFGRCKRKEIGKCVRKHDPDQIALCTKFLQGACVDQKCLLSHNVSPEKMPTCKFYLEGSCSRDDCPYLHVRISPKADICKDFLEGFCKKAAECDKRHQFLCPDYEKHGNCLKQRCPYPHGRMVRKYSVFDKNKFAKKSSNDRVTKVVENEQGAQSIGCSKSEKLKPVENSDSNVKSRYYIGQNNVNIEDEMSASNDTNGTNTDQCAVKSRPKLGKLPSFIAFEDI